MSQNTADYTKWEINENVFVLDLSDADTAEIYEKAVEEMRKNEKHIQTGNNSEIIRNYCTMFENFYDTIFGEGTSEKLFNGNHNSRICNEVWDDFLNFVSTQTKAANNLAENLKTRYTVNRATRRAARNV